MMTFALFSLAVLWIATLRRYPSLFIPRKSATLAMGGQGPGEDWIEVLPSPIHHEAASMQPVA